MAQRLAAAAAAARTRLLADAEFEQVAADRHALRVELVQEAACVALHAQPPQPVGAHRLAVVAGLGGGAAPRVAAPASTPATVLFIATVLQ